MLSLERVRFLEFYFVKNKSRAKFYASIDFFFFFQEFGKLQALFLRYTLMCTKKDHFSSRNKLLFFKKWRKEFGPLIKVEDLLSQPLHGHR